MNLREKTISGLTWSFIDTFANQGISFLIGIILARILSPQEFGLLGMTTVFIALSQSFVDSGFESALIRKNDCSDEDYSTVFYFNLAAGLLFFFVLFFLSPKIALFFREPLLEKIIPILGLLIIIDSFSIIQRTILIKRVDFKLQTRISFIASVISGLIAILLAYRGFGVWSLVFQRLSLRAISTVLLWFFNRWRPSWIFSLKSFKELFGFGSKLLLSGLINTLYENIYYLIIGKYISARELGYYTTADGFQRIPSQNFTGIIGRVSYPILSNLQDDRDRLKTTYQKLIKSTMLITFILMLGMAAVAKPMILTLIGEKWQPSIVYLQLLCFVGMLYPLHALNLNMLKVSGRSDLFLKLEVIKKILAIPTIIISVFWGVEAMIVGMMMNSMVGYFINSYWSGQFVGYNIKLQIADILPSFGIALLMAAIVFIFGSILPFDHLWVLIIQILIGVGFIIIFCESTRFKDYLFLKGVLVKKIMELSSK